MIGVLPLLIAATVLHPSHQTLAEVEWNAETGRMEVAMMLDVLDEQWIERHHGAGASGDGVDERVDEWRLRYLGRHFRFLADRAETDRRETVKGAAVRTDQAGIDAVGRAADRYRWVGRKQEGSHVWWFFEVAPRGGERPRSLTSRVLFDRDDRYVHRVVVLGTKPRRIFELTPDRPSGELRALSTTTAER